MRPALSWFSPVLCSFLMLACGGGDSPESGGPDTSVEDVISTDDTSPGLTDTASPGTTDTATAGDTSTLSDTSPPGPVSDARADTATTPNDTSRPVDTFTNVDAAADTGSTPPRIELDFERAAPLTAGAIAGVRPLVFQSPNSRVHALYVAHPVGDLWFARRTPDGEFQRERVAPALDGEDIGLLDATAFDDGVVRALFSRSKQNNDRYLYFEVILALRSATGTWTFQTMAAPTPVFHYSGMRLDGTGMPVSVGFELIATNTCESAAFRYDGTVWTRFPLGRLNVIVRNVWDCDPYDIRLTTDGRAHLAVIQFVTQLRNTSQTEVYEVYTRDDDTSTRFTRHTPPDSLYYKPYEFAAVATDGTLHLVDGSSHTFGKGAFWSEEQVSISINGRVVAKHFHLAAGDMPTFTFQHNRKDWPLSEVTVEQYRRTGPATYARSAEFKARVGFQNDSHYFGSWNTHLHVTPGGEPFVTPERTNSRMAKSRGLDFVDWPGGATGAARSVALDWAESVADLLDVVVHADGTPFLFVQMGDGTDERYAILKRTAENWHEFASLGTEFQKDHGITRKGALAFDSAGQLHAVWARNRALVHATITSAGQVTTELVDAGTFIGAGVAFAIASDGTIHAISFGSADTRYYVQRSTGWTHELMGQTGLGLMLDGNQVPIAVKIGSGSVRFGKRGANAWQFTLATPHADGTYGATYTDAGRVCVLHFSREEAGTLSDICLDGDNLVVRPLARGLVSGRIRSATRTADGIYVFVDTSGSDTVFEPTLVRVNDDGTAEQWAIDDFAFDDAFIAGGAGDGSLWFLYRYQAPSWLPDWNYRGSTIFASRR